MSAKKYVTAAVKNVEEALAKKGLRLPSKCYTPLTTDYKPELETSPELKADGVQYYQELIGILRWAVELGKVNILLLETLLMSTYLAMPRSGHLEHETSAECLVSSNYIPSGSCPSIRSTQRSANGCSLATTGKISTAT